MNIRTKKYLIFLYLINPLLSLFVAINRYHLKQYRWVVYLVLAYFGYILSFTIESADGFRHTEDFLTYTTASWGDFFKDLELIYSRTTLKVDYYTTVVHFLVSRLISNPSFAFSVHALVFGFFYLKVINLAYDEFGSKTWPLQLLLFGIIIVMPPLTQLNALRYPIALWIWTYGALFYLKSGHLKYLLVTATASLVHLGITPATAVLLGYHFLGKRTNIYFLFYAASFALANLVSFEAIIELSKGLGAGIERRVTGYTSEDYQQLRASGISEANWYVIWRYTLFNWFITFGVLYLYFLRNKVWMDDFQNALLAFILLYAGYINLVIDIPSFGGRQRWFLWIIVLFALYRLIAMNPSSQRVKWIGHIGLFPIFLYGLVEIRTMFYYVTIDLIISNPILMFFGKTEILLEEFIS